MLETTRPPMQHPRHHRAMQRKLSMYALIVACIVTALLPIVYFAAGLRSQRVVLETEAQINGLLINQLIATSPDSWLDRAGLETVLARRQHKDIPENRQVFTTDGRLIVQATDDDVSVPV